MNLQRRPTLSTARLMVGDGQHDFAKLPLPEQREFPTIQLRCLRPFRWRESSTNRRGIVTHHGDAFDVAVGQEITASEPDALSLLALQWVERI